MLYSVPSGAPAVLPPGWVGCVPGKKAGTGDRLSDMFIAALAFDTIVFALTLGRSLYLRWTNAKARLVQLIVRDGELYLFQSLFPYRLHLHYCLIEGSIYFL